MSEDREAGAPARRRILKGAAPLLALLAAGFTAASVAWPQVPATPSVPAGAQQPPPPRGQPFRWPDHIRNRRVLPASTTAEQLRATMRGFAVSLGVRCTFCHTGTEQMSLAERDFTSDANPRKNIARQMIRMVERLNRELPRIVDSDSHVTCYTCHRGSATPATVAPMPTAPPPGTPPPATPRP